MKKALIQKIEKNNLEKKEEKSKVHVLLGLKSQASSRD
jgi:hypothetical protein